MTFDQFFKQMIRDFLKGCEIFPDTPVGKLPLKIDLIIKCPKKATGPVAISILETHFAPINLFEYKSSHDLPKKQDLAKLMGYLGLYCDQHEVGLDEIPAKFSLWYIAAKYPVFLGELLNEQIIVETGTPGLYQLQVPFLCPYFVLVINELEIIEENLPLLLLSSGEPLKNTIRMMDQKGIIQPSKLEKYLRLAYVMNYEVLGKMTEMERLLPESVRRSIKLLIQDIGLREVIEQIGLDEVIKVIGRDEVIKAIGLDEMIKTVGLDEVIKAVGLDKVEKALRKLKKRPK